MATHADTPPRPVRTPGGAGDQVRDAQVHPAVRTYTVVCLLALLVLAVALMEQVPDWWGLVPVLAGIAAVLFRWSIGPPLLLLSLTGVLFYINRLLPWWYQPQPSVLTLFVLCGSVLVSVAGQYRFQALTRQVFPRDPRRPAAPPGAGHKPAGRRAPAPAQRRSPGLVTSPEMILLVLAPALWCLLAFLVWRRVQQERPLLDIDGHAWRLLLLFWFGAVGLAVAAVVLSYLGWSRAARAEGLLYLQDQLWRGTRAEQATLNRWLVWARRRQQRRQQGAGE